MWWIVACFALVAAGDSTPIIEVGLAAGSAPNSAAASMIAEEAALFDAMLTDGMKKVQDAYAAAVQPHGSSFLQAKLHDPAGVRVRVGERRTCLPKRKLV